MIELSSSLFSQIPGPALAFPHFDYNTRLVFAAVSLLGAVSGIVGTFLLLRKRALMSDTLSHATLPGIAMAFLIAVSLGDPGGARSLPVLLLGAAVGGWIGVVTVGAITRSTGLKDDAAMAIVLSVFFGVGIVLMGFIQQLPGASAAGLEGFIYGKVASMVRLDLYLMAGVAAVAGLLCVGLLKEFRLICFDPAFARVQGWPVARLDGALMALVTLVTIAGLQAVGLILIIALLIIPAASARCWSHRLGPLLILGALLGAFGAGTGALFSASATKAPAGAVIVLTMVVVFIFSQFFGTSGGWVPRWRMTWQRRRQHAEEHLLRAFFELCELRGHRDTPLTGEALAEHRAWRPGELRRAMQRAFGDKLLRKDAGGQLQLTGDGWRRAERLTRNHRLWEQYLLDYADIAPAHINHQADAIEHVLGDALVERLERRLQVRRDAVPPSRHELGPESREGRV